MSKSNHRRLHSNTISGDRPPAIDTSIRPPSSPRRNSEGSPRLPPINISAPTPISPNSLGVLSLDQFPHRNPDDPVQDETTPEQASRSCSPAPTPVVGPESSSAQTTLPSVMPDRLVSQSGNSRSRRSSLSAGPISDVPLPESKQPQRKQLRRGSDDTEDDAISEGEFSTVAGSIANACGVDVASAKRNQDFHALFRSVPEDDPLISDFGCALQKEILLQGRIYISENHLCFNANIFGWVTNLVIAFADIVEIEKRTTAIFIPNAIQVSTLHAKHFFASFLSRDQAYDLMVDVWRCARPPTGLGKTETRDGTVSKNGDAGENDDLSDETDTSTTSGSDMNCSDDCEESDDMYMGDGAAKDGPEGHLQQPRQSSLASLPFLKQVKSNEAEAARRRAVSEAGARPDTRLLLSNRSKSRNKSGDKILPLSDKTNTAQVHEKTECECSKNGDHLPNVAMDQTYCGTVEKIFNLMYNSAFSKKFLLEVQKNTDLNMGQWRKGDGGAKYTREISYVKSLNNAIGPKSTKCLLTEDIMEIDMANSVTIVTTTQTPDVPSGSTFNVKTRVCITWAGKGQVRVLVTVLVVFTKSIWLKSTIEKASMEGQTSFYKDLDAAIRKYTEAHPNEIYGETKDGKRRKKGKTGKRQTTEDTTKVKTPDETNKNSFMHHAMDLLSNITSTVISWLIENASIPSTSQLTVFCMLLMVIVNLFIASKMRDLEQKLTTISTTGSHTKSPLTSRYTRPDDNDLWEWLGRLDPDKEAKTATESDFLAGRQDTDAPWQEKWQESQSAKNKIDQHLVDLGRMIERAEKSMEQVTNVVNQQRQRIKGEWSM
ncbi:hypothetical protein DFQ28_002257 [Apophysomyces sp. BC1034]|nr:hypothetical protein DFQ30_002654 [Apophysomyces sp. BC1015]KAG0179329.1 hypothetical protein DFQ29_002243 [Apophysomyces sp. BC1021]KAG0190276.1 hypothetical protein DFQ28_002257 [Apophysomyces sp. BC1034]